MTQNFPVVAQEWENLGTRRQNLVYPNDTCTWSTSRTRPTGAASNQDDDTTVPWTSRETRKLRKVRENTRQTTDVIAGTKTQNDFSTIY